MTLESDKIKDAYDFADEHHDGMEDKYGNPYFEHLERVANRVREMEYDFVDETSEIELYVATAYLHDIVEDTNITREELSAAFGEVVIAAIFKLTRDKGMTYAAYIDRIVEPLPPIFDLNPFESLVRKIAKVVKLADLLDHVSGPTACPPSLKKRYEKSLYLLISKGF